jgi:hypothetical protein
MESNLRPLTLGEILDRTAQLYRSNFLLFAGIFSVYCGVGLVLNLILIGLGQLLKSLHVTGSTILLINLFAGGLELLALFLLFGAAVAAISRAVAWVNLGEPASIRSAYVSTLPRLRRYLWLMTITAVTVWSPLALLYGGYFSVLTFYVKGAGAAGVAAGQSPASNPHAVMILVVATVAFILLLIPAGIYTALMALRYSLALPACVIENTKARASIRRSIDLSKGSRGRIFVLGLLVAIIKIGLALLSQAFVIVAAYRHHGEVPPALNALSQIIAFFTNTFVGPIYAAGITLFYYDQRMRKEGFDIEWMMQAAGLTVPEPESAPQESQSQNALPEAGILHE